MGGLGDLGMGVVGGFPAGAVDVTAIMFGKSTKRDDRRAEYLRIDCNFRQDMGLPLSITTYRMNLGAGFLR